MSKEGPSRTEECGIYSVFDALSIAQAVKRGEAVLISPVIFHTKKINVTVHWKPVQGTAEAVLQKHRERLKQALQRRLNAMEQETFAGWTEAEIDGFCTKYSQYKALLETCK